jgi:hypothetical protein
VKKGRVYKTPAIDPATAAGGEIAYLWFAEIGYPDLFDRRHAHAREGRLQAALWQGAQCRQVDQLMQMEWNGKSAGYAETFGRRPMKKDIGFVTSGDGAQLQCYRDYQAYLDAELYLRCLDQVDLTDFKAIVIPDFSHPDLLRRTRGRSTTIWPKAAFSSSSNRTAWMNGWMSSRSNGSRAKPRTGNGG